MGLPIQQIMAQAIETVRQRVVGTLTADITDNPARELGKVDATVTGSKAEEASAQETEAVTSVKTYTRAVGASEIGIYVESGSIRVRTDGNPATATTGVPLGEGFMEAWAVESISVYFVEASTITVVSR